MMPKTTRLTADERRAALEDLRRLAGMPIPAILGPLTRHRRQNMAKETAPDLTPCYIGRKPCGCAVAFITDDAAFRDSTAKLVAQWVRDGLVLERTTVDAVRSAFGDCTHETEPRGSGR